MKRKKLSRKKEQNTTVFATSKWRQTPQGQGLICLLLVTKVLDPKSWVPQLLCNTLQAELLSGPIMSPMGLRDKVNWHNYAEAPAVFHTAQGFEQTFHQRGYMNS